MTPRRTTIPKRRRSISSPASCSDVKSSDNAVTLETLMQSLLELELSVHSGAAEMDLLHLKVAEVNEAVTKVAVEIQETAKGQATLLSKNPI